MYTSYVIVTLYEWSWWLCSTQVELSQSSTCFEQYYAHPQEVKLYVYRIWYRHSL
jgi:hypothetical protein